MDAEDTADNAAIFGRIRVPMTGYTFGNLKSRNPQLRPRHAVTRTHDHMMMCLQAESIPDLPISNLTRTNLFINYKSTISYSSNV